MAEKGEEEGFLESMVLGIKEGPGLVVVVVVREEFLFLDLYSMVEVVVVVHEGFLFLDL